MSELEKINYVLEAEDKRAAMDEVFPGEYELALKEHSQALNEYRLLPVLIVTGIIIGWLIEKLIKFINEHKKKDIPEIEMSLKKLDDKFVKVNQFLGFGGNKYKVDKNARVNAEIRSIVLRDKDNPSKMYKLVYSGLIYNPEPIAAYIEQNLRYCATLDGEAKTTQLKAFTQGAVTSLSEDFMKNYGYILFTEPYCKVSMYNNIKLGEVLKAYDEWIKFIHGAVDAYNKNLEIQLQYFQLCNQSYNNLTSKYGKDKECKDAIDQIYKVILTNSQNSLEFNNKALIILNEMIKFYTEELDKFVEMYKK